MVMCSFKRLLGLMLGLSCTSVTAAPKPSLVLVNPIEHYDSDGKHTFQLQLSGNPGQNTQVFLNNPSFFFDRCSLQFTPNNWNQPQDVTMYARPDLSGKPDLSASFAINTKTCNSNYAQTKTLKATRVISSGATCSSSGDPHIRTFDQATYSNMMQGTQWLVQHEFLKIQTQQYLCRAPNIRCNIAFAVQYKSDVVLIDFTKWIKGRPANDQSSTIFLPGQKKISDLSYLKVATFKDGTQHKIYIANTGRLLASMDYNYGTYAHAGITVTLTAEFAGEVSGMCGNMNGNPGDEFTASDESSYGSSNPGPYLARNANKFIQNEIVITDTTQNLFETCNADSYDPANCPQPFPAEQHIVEPSLSCPALPSDCTPPKVIVNALPAGFIMPPNQPFFGLFPGFNSKKRDVSTDASNKTLTFAYQSDYTPIGVNVSTSIIEAINSTCNFTILQSGDCVFMTGLPVYIDAVLNCNNDALAAYSSKDSGNAFMQEAQDRLEDLLQICHHALLSAADTASFLDQASNITTLSATPTATTDGNQQTDAAPLLTTDFAVPTAAPRIISKRSVSVGRVRSQMAVIKQAETLKLTGLLSQDKIFRSTQRLTSVSKLYSVSKAFGFGDAACPSDCNSAKGNGKCTDGGCKCKRGFGGIACDLNFAAIKMPKLTTRPKHALAH